MQAKEAVQEVPLTGKRCLPDSEPCTTAVEAFEAVVRAHQRQIYRILLLQLRDADAAETLTQECFLRAYAKWHDFRGEANVRTWLIRIALNLARDHMKSRRLAFWRQLGRAGANEDQQLPELPATDPLADRRLVAREELAAIWATVNRLPGRQQRCFVLRYVEELPVAEIAEALQIEIGTVKAHLARAVGAIRRRLSQSEQACMDI